MKINCAVIIPCVRVDEDTKICIKRCLEQKNAHTKIYVVSDSEAGIENSGNVVYLNFGPINMSEKRNRAVNCCEEEFLAFIDSDAYPADDWLINAITILNSNNGIGLVSGPDFPFASQNSSAKLIGAARGSFWLSGFKAFRKNSKKPIFCNQVSSCNMVMKRSVFEEIGGMDENIYIGEDIDFCDRITRRYEICFSPNVIVFHRSRELIPFFAQRYAFGAGVFDAIKKKNTPGNLQYFGPLLILTFHLGFVTIIFSSIYKLLYLLLFSTFILSLLYDSIRYSTRISEVPKLFSILYFGILAFGLGSLMRLLGFAKKVKKIYTYRT